MLFTDEFIESLREDPVSGTIALCDLTLKELNVHGRVASIEEDFTILIEAYSLLAEIIETGVLPIHVKLPIIENGKSDQCPKIYSWVQHVREACMAEETKLRVSALRSRFRVSLGSGFAYEFSQGDLNKVQDLVNQLRSLIASAINLEKEHQQRLLRRLERLQSELHKKVSDLDRFWGLIGDAGVVLGKLGNDAKPIVDRIREIADVVWQTQSRAEELPSGTKLPQLEHKPSSSSEEA